MSAQGTLSGSLQLYTKVNSILKADNDKSKKTETLTSKYSSQRSGGRTTI